MGAKPRGISGSRAAAVLGQSPWATPFSVWQDIMEKRQPGFNAARGFEYEAFEGNASTRWGLAFEDAVIKLAEERAGIYIDEREAEYSADDMEYVTCHIDGKYGYKVHTVDEIKRAIKILHEGKTTTSYGFSDKWGEPGTDKIPVEYQIQTQHQMLCTGADECIVSVLVFPKRPEEWEEMGLEVSDKTLHIDKHGVTSIGHHGNYSIYKDDKVFATPEQWAASLSAMGFFHQYTVPAKPELQAKMLERYQAWWTKHVIGETPPEPESYDDIRSMITAPVGTIIVDADTARWFKEYKDIGAEIGSTGNLAKRKEQLKVTILDHARVLEKTLDDESTDKWVFRDDAGKKLGSYSRNKNGSMVFR